MPRYIQDLAAACSRLRYVGIAVALIYAAYKRRSVVKWAREPCEIELQGVVRTVVVGDGVRPDSERRENGTCDGGGAASTAASAAAAADDAAAGGGDGDGGGVGGDARGDLEATRSEACGRCGGAEEDVEHSQIEARSEGDGEGVSGGLNMSRTEPRGGGCDARGGVKHLPTEARGSHCAIDFEESETDPYDSRGATRDSDMPEISGNQFKGSLQLDGRSLDLVERRLGLVGVADVPGGGGDKEVDDEHSEGHICASRTSVGGGRSAACGTQAGYGVIKGGLLAGRLRDAGSWDAPSLIEMCNYKGVAEDFFSHPAPATRHQPSLAVVKLRFGSPDEYLRTMQAHTDAEFACGLRKARETAFRHNDGGWRRWRPLGARKRGYVMAVEDCDDWVDDPWVLHAVEFEGTEGIYLITSSGTAESDDPPCPEELVDLLLPERAFGRWNVGAEGYAVVRGPMKGPLASRAMHRMECETPQDLRALQEKYAEGGRVRSLGFVGSYMLAYESAQRLRICLTAGPSSLEKYQWALLRDVACPGPISHAERERLDPTLQSPEKVDTLPGDAVNSSQKDAIRKVREGLSLIHGPPGTGKSTTILHLINTRTHPGSKVLVTCTRNQAVNAVVEKVAGVKGGVLAFGLEKNLGETTRKYTLQARVRSDPAIEYLTDLWGTWREKLTRLSGGKRKKSRKHLRRWHEEWVRCGAPNGLTADPALASQIATVFDRLVTPPSTSTVEAWSYFLKECLSVISACFIEASSKVRNRILRETRVYVCTIDSTPRFVREMREATAESNGDDSSSEYDDDSVAIDTVIVDEAGCVLETAIPVLLRWAPANLVLIGDHMQLAPYTSLDDLSRATGYELAMVKGGHARSLMERCTLAEVPAPMLTIQYRMHPSICHPVSLLFYKNHLQSHNGLDVRRSKSGLARKAGGAAVWVDTKGPETALPKAGYRNESEIDVVMQILPHVMGRGRTVFVITFYNAQRYAIEDGIKMEYEKLPDGVSVLSVDAAQGSEADVVILSTVRSGTHTATLGSFMQDRRRVCVALSRAKELCVVVGNAEEMRQKGGKKLWGRVVRAYKRIEPWY